MKALSITHSEITKACLLRMAEKIPGAWIIGIRIAGNLLLLSRWKSTQVADLFGLSRLGVVKWIRKTNQMGLASVEDRPRSGRPSRIREEVLKYLDQVLSKPPKEVGISRDKWDGVRVVEYSKRYHQIPIHVRFKAKIIDLWVDNAR